MNRVAKRIWLMGLFVMILLGGMVFFLADYWANGAVWVSSPGSPHVLQHNNVGIGSVTDRSGLMLLDFSGGRTYSERETIRKSTMHWLGDREGKISAGAVSHYAGAMVGFDPINGVYNAEDVQGITTLTLSAKVQNVALEAMAGRKGTVAVYNYKTGEILCALTTPTFDPDNVPDISSDTTGAYEGVYLNRFLQSSYPPGSIFKVVTTAAALECVDDIQNMTFSCTGRMEYGEGNNVAAVTCAVAHGNQPLRNALANSCNCAYAQIAELIGKENMVEYVNRYAVTAPISFDGVTSAKGNYDLNRAAMVSFAWSCIGQHTDLVNPAAFMTFMGAIANGGQAVQPYIVSRVTCGGEVTYQAEPETLERIMPREIAETVKAYMRGAVKNVYGDWNFDGMNVCAKSGTSQLGGDQVSNAMFAGFVADEQYPLAFMVVVENGGYGSSACVPVLSKVLAACRTVMDAS